MGPPKEILFEIDLVPGTWYLGKDLRLENPRPRREGFALSGAVWRSLAAFNTGVDLKSPFGGLWRPLAAFGGLWRPLAAFGVSLAAFNTGMGLKITPWRPLALCRVFVVLLWVVPRLLWRCRGSCRVFGAL